MAQQGAQGGDRRHAVQGQARERAGGAGVVATAGREGEIIQPDLGAVADAGRGVGLTDPSALAHVKRELVELGASHAPVAAKIF